MTVQSKAQREPFPFSKFISSTLLVAGTTIGAGMLGMPLITCGAGFWPAFFVTCISWAFMLITGLFLLEVCYQMPKGSNLLSLSAYYLGKKGKYFVGFLFVFLYYCLLVAYFSAGSSLVASFLGCSASSALLLFTTAFGIVVALGAKSIDRVNSVFTLAMFVCYAFLIVLGSKMVDASRLCYSVPAASVVALPILFSAFGYHNIIPSLTNHTHVSKGVLRLCIFLGTFIALVIFLLWQWVIIGSIPQHVLHAALLAGEPVTFALQSLAKKPQIYFIGQCFAFFALTTSVLGVCFSMVDFLKEAVKMGGKCLHRSLLTLLVFLPPAVCVLWNPILFDKALGLSGGVGEAFLNGFIPLIFFFLYMKKINHRFYKSLFHSLLILSSLFCFYVVCIEIKSLFIS